MPVKFGVVGFLNGSRLKFINEPMRKTKYYIIWERLNLQYMVWFYSAHLLPFKCLGSVHFPQSTSTRILISNTVEVKSLHSPFRSCKIVFCQNKVSYKIHVFVNVVLNSFICNYYRRFKRLLKFQKEKACIKNRVWKLFEFEDQGKFNVFCLLGNM